MEAVLIGFADNGVLHYFQKGFNPEFSADDLGTAMLGLCVKACCDDKEIRAFDFMGGGAAYKWMWTHEHRALVGYEAQRWNARTIAQDAWALSVDTTARLYRATAPTCVPRRAAPLAQAAPPSRGPQNGGAGYGCDEVDRGFAFFAHWSAQLSISATVCSTDSRA